MVVYETHFVVGSCNSNRAPNLRSTRNVESRACVFVACETLRAIRTVYLSFARSNYLASQSLDLPAEVRTVERVFYLRAVWDGQPTSPPLKP